MSYEVENVPEAIKSAKQRFQANDVDYKAVFDALTAEIQAEVDEIKRLKAAGESVVPELQYEDIVNGRISEEQKALLRQRGCAVIRGVFAEQKALGWGEDVRQYIEDSGYLEAPDKGLDKYFSSLQDVKPQIYSVYWSKPQIEARQSENLALTRQLLNRLWNYEVDGEMVFDPDKECTYADRTRRRQPGDDSLGLKPHMDGGSVERWIDEQGFHKVYRHLISGEWQKYDPFDALYRTETREIPSPAVCQMFRTFQGWTALSKQGPGDGTLQLIPISRGMAWMFLRALQSDVPIDELCGAKPARALQCVPEWHGLLLEALTEIPLMQPGDTVWWHPDVVHAVEDKHTGDQYSNVIYIGAAPLCEKNKNYLPEQYERFKQGKSAPDFAAEDYELDYAGRAMESDLTELGKQQMGAMPWQ